MITQLVLFGSKFDPGYAIVKNSPNEIGGEPLPHSTREGSLSPKKSTHSAVFPCSCDDSAHVEFTYLNERENKPTLSIGVLTGFLTGVLIGVLIGTLMGSLTGVLIGELIGFLTGALIGFLTGSLFGSFLGCLTGGLMEVCLVSEASACGGEKKKKCLVCESYDPVRLVEQKNIDKLNIL